MPRVDKTMLVAVLAGAAIAAVSASCANSCSGHGSCGSHDRCTCYAMWEGTDCSKKVCPSGPSFGSGGSTYEVCSGRGSCDSGSGTCTCSEGYTGYNCGRTACPNDCSGHGKCASTGIDNGMTRACVCDGYYTGIDCSFRQCPRGDDPLTTEIECQGVSSGAQSHEVQEITLTADKQLSGEMTLTYTDAYGQSWTTMPIGVGGDLEYDLRMSGAGGCSLKYMSATLTSEKFRESNDLSTDTNFDFGATEFGIPGVMAAAMNGVDCDELSAADMQSLLELNGVVKNVQVTKSGDASTGTARFHVSVGDLNFQNENDGMEIGVFSMTNRNADAEFHSLGDRSQAIKDALQALPYNVIPSVEVSRVKVDGGSDYADSTVVYGNMVKQKYRITFSDAANAGDQAMLQCNAEGCDADGCAPRYKGVTHKRYISTKYGADPMSTEGSGVTDYRTAIVATGQGSWWLRSHSLDSRTQSPFTSGTYHVHWDLGNGKVSSASFPYNADQATIQSALRTIEGWGGVSVSCHGTPGFAGRKYNGVDAEHFGLQCKVTYAKGFEDGGKLPTMTYENIHQGMDSAIESSGKPTHFTNLMQSNVGVTCTNQMCILSSIGEDTTAIRTNKDYTTMSLFNGGFDTRASATKTCGSDFGDCKSSKQDNFIGYVYIRHDGVDKLFPNEGTYEIVRVGSGMDTRDVVDLIIYAPGVPDITDRNAAFGTTSTARLYKATPLMPMWPSFSNTIAVHDTSFRMTFAPSNVSARLGPSDASSDAWDSQNTLNLVYGPYNAKLHTAANTIGIGTECSSILNTLKALTPTAPFPSLASADGNSICDCKRTTMEVEPFEVELTVTCPGWLGYLLNSDAVNDGATDVATFLDSFHDYEDTDLIVQSNTDLEYSPVNVYTGHRRLAPERSLEQLVAIGDTITVVASGSNDNKQFSVKSFAYDNMWGDGNKGSAIWSAKAGYLGKDAAAGFASVVTLDSAIDYASYGDFVPFLKVHPAPSDDYVITEMYTEGTNGTSFTRTLEDISTLIAEVATLTVYDKPSTEGDTTAGSNVKFDARSLSGTFQLIYDGEESPVIPATASANQLMAYLSEMKSLAHVPTVKKCCKADGTNHADNVEAVPANLDSVQWQITFDPRLGDAKKLTFKFVDASTDERKTSNIIGSGNSALTNELVSETSDLNGAKTLVSANNKIVMTYSSGSAFIDALDDDFIGHWSQSSVDDQEWDDMFHDELAMDVVPGTKMKVSSAETHHMYVYQMVSEAAQEDLGELAAGCINTPAEEPHVVIEYAGKFAAPVNLCKASGATLNPPATIAGAISGANGISELKGISVTIDAEYSGTAVTGITNTNAAGMKLLFDDHFPWGAGHNGKARGRVSFTLPIGANGDSFKVHFQRGMVKTTGHHLFAGASKKTQYKIFTYRERNNNGREFTVTKAYENKVSDLISVSRIASYVGDTDGGALAGVISTVDKSNAAASDDWRTAESSLAGNLGCGNRVNGAMTPGTYHNVRTRYGVSGSGNGAGAILMVVVGGDKKVHEVQITSGGNGKYLLGAQLRFADTRIHPNMAYTASGESDVYDCTFEVGNMATTGTMNSPLKSVASGITTDSSSLPSGSYTACLGITQAAGACDTDGADARFRNVPTDLTATSANQDAVKGLRMAVECATSTAIDELTVTFGGLGGLNAASGSRGVETPMITTSAEENLRIAVGTGAGQFTVKDQCINDFYYQFGFYSTNTPRYARDLSQNNYDMGRTPKDEQVALYGMKNHMQYQYKYASTNQATNSFYGLGRDTFSDLNAGMDTNMGGYSIRDSGNDNYPQMTASVLAGENGQFPTDSLMEHAEKYAYIGKGYDKLTVSPVPDAMTKQKVIIEYTGPSAGCEVTEVDRGTHESSECSGRGNCDYSTGTCVCDAGYTLEACSEQTVLV